MSTKQEYKVAKLQTRGIVRTYAQLEKLAQERRAVVVQNHRYRQCGRGRGGHNAGMLAARYLLNAPAQVLMEMLRAGEIREYKRKHPRTVHEEAIVRYDLHFSRDESDGWWFCFDVKHNSTSSKGRTKKAAIERYLELNGHVL